ncbi:hypothetical protein KEM48_004399 [Puccinia striiformis f. sp. tritici PST-130]|nr:hypothetical protein KEM48_004399 [Puccinia striiformis f. sp. tritici PST-130]
MRGIGRFYKGPYGASNLHRCLKAAYQDIPSGGFPHNARFCLDLSTLSSVTWPIIGTRVEYIGMSGQREESDYYSVIEPLGDSSSTCGYCHSNRIPVTHMEFGPIAYHPRCIK